MKKRFLAVLLISMMAAGRALTAHADDGTVIGSADEYAITSGDESEPGSEAEMILPEDFDPEETSEQEERPGRNDTVPEGSGTEAAPGVILGGVVTDWNYFGTDADEFTFDSSRTALEHLEGLFTTIDLMDATIADLTREMEAGNLTSEKLTGMYIDRILAYDFRLKLNSITSINPNALDEARQLDAERAAGRIRGPLHGIPIIVKDNIDVAGTATTGGSLALAHMVAPKDAEVVSRLKAAGAVIVAKANLSEFASSAIDSKSLFGGVVHNAYDISRVPAGSSGGTGVSVTSNFAAVGLGTDTGGSIRNPASYSNLYGIRPTKGLTSIDGIIPLMAPRDTVGPMARTVEDLALTLEIMAGNDEKDDFTLEADADALVGDGYLGALRPDGLQGKRIAYLTSSFEYDYSPYETNGDGEVNLPSERVDAMIKRTRAILRKAGAEFVDLSGLITDKMVREIENTNSDYTTEYDFNRYLYEKGDAAPYKTLKDLYLSGKAGIDYTNLPVSESDLDTMADSFETTVNPYTVEVGGYMRGETWPEMLSWREQIMQIMEENDIDAIMYLATLDVPPSYDNMMEELRVNYMGWTYGFAFGPCLGMPDIVIPMGFSDPYGDVTTELPLGMRLVGKYGDEANLIEMAYAYEQQAGPSIRKMPANSPALEDRNLEAYLEALMEQVYSIDYDLYFGRPEGLIRLMETAYKKAAAADTSDPYIAYEAAEKLARAYDKVMEALKRSGFNIAGASVSGIKNCTYNGEAQTQNVTVKMNGKILVPDADYSVKYKNNINAGTAQMIIKGKGAYAGTLTKTFTVKKAANSITKVTSSATLSEKTLKTRSQSFKIEATVKGNAKKTFALSSAPAKVRKYIFVSASGRVAVKKGMPKGTFTVKVKIQAKESANYRAASAVKSVKIKVK